MVALISSTTGSASSLQPYSCSADRHPGSNAIHLSSVRLIRGLRHSRCILHCRRHSSLGGESARESNRHTLDCILLLLRSAIRFQHPDPPLDRDRVRLFDHPFLLITQILHRSLDIPTSPRLAQHPMLLPDTSPHRCTGNPWLDGRLGIFRDGQAGSARTSLWDYPFTACALSETPGTRRDGRDARHGRCVQVE